MEQFGSAFFFLCLRQGISAFEYRSNAVPTPIQDRSSTIAFKGV